MILNKITKEEINLFCNKFGCNVEEFKPTFNGAYYLKMFSGCMGPQPEFHVTDTSCVGINYYKSYDLTKQWIEFLNEIEKYKEEKTEQTI